MCCVVLDSTDNVAEEKAGSTLTCEIYTKPECGWVYENQFVTTDTVGFYKILLS